VHRRNTLNALIALYTENKNVVNKRMKLSVTSGCEFAFVHLRFIYFFHNFVFDLPYFHLLASFTPKVGFSRASEEAVSKATAGDDS